MPIDGIIDQAALTKNRPRVLHMNGASTLKCVVKMSQSFIVEWIDSTRYSQNSRCHRLKVEKSGFTWRHFSLKRGYARLSL